MRTITAKIVSTDYDDGIIYYKEIFGVSTESKPTDVATGSKFTEVDTGDVYLFCEGDPGSWTKQFSLQPAAETVEDDT